MKKTCYSKQTQGKLAYRRGLWAERVVCFFLLLKGYLILERRYKTNLGEIDVIVLRGKTLVFVEVKARARQEQLAEVISSHQQQRLFRAAQLFLAKNPCYIKHDLRFDAVLLAPFRLPQHIQDAFHE
jgi:putative endonuclease